MRYLHHKSRSDDAALLATAFSVDRVDAASANRPGRPGAGAGAIY
jgi:hypothetical protein